GLPLSFQIRKGERGNMYFWWAVGVGSLTLLFPTTIGVYCLLVFSMLYVLEQLAGKTNFIFTFHLLLLSPLFQYFNSLISFPIRLALSETAGKMLQMAGFEIQVSGNLIRLDGADFLVDSACSGLFMLRYSFLFAILILAYFQIEGKRWELKEIIPLLALL